MTRTSAPAPADQGVETCRRCGRPLTDPLAVHDRLGQRCRRRWLLEGNPGDEITSTAATQTPGELLRAGRRQLDLTQQQVADRVQRNRTGLQLAEQDRRPLPLEVLALVAKVLAPADPTAFVGAYLAALARTPDPHGHPTPRP